MQEGFLLTLTKLSRRNIQEHEGNIWGIYP